MTHKVNEGQEVNTLLAFTYLANSLISRKTHCRAQPATH